MTSVTESAAGRVGIACAAVGCVLIGAGSFMPWATSTFLGESHSLSGFDPSAEGQWTLALAILVGFSVILTLFSDRGATVASAIILAAGIGAGLVALLDYQETSRSQEEARGEIAKTVLTQGGNVSDFRYQFTPGTGTWAVFAGSALALGGGIALIARRNQPATPESPASPPELVKQCPRCAETVKEAAHVCRFCGYEFADS